MYSWFRTNRRYSMQKKKQRKIIYIMGASFLVFILASTAIAMKYDDYVDYVVWGGYIYAALLFVASIVLLIKEKAA
jgi:predicted lysophospholipase L1 biosynthesis ABC-type transport system permease subunit